MSYTERRTDTNTQHVNYLFNKPMSSSDINELQSTIQNNIMKLLSGKLSSSTVKFVINTDAVTPGTSSGNATISFPFNFVVVDDKTDYLVGSINNSNLIIPLGAVNTVFIYDIYMHYNLREVTPSDIVYKDGLRSNPYNSLIVEEEVQNNIGDESLGEITTRNVLEMTFYAVVGSADPYEMSGWSQAVKIGTAYGSTSGTITVKKNSLVSKILDPSIMSAIGSVRSVNGIEPDGEGNVYLERVELADNIYSPDDVTRVGDFVIRTSGGTSPISTGTATLSKVRGKSEVKGRVFEQISTTASSPLNSTVDIDVWRETDLAETGNYTFTYDITRQWHYDSQVVNLADYGISVSGMQAEVCAVMSSNPDVVAIIDKDTWNSSPLGGTTGTYSFIFSETDNSWQYNGQNVNIADYGITISSGTPANLNVLVVNYNTGTVSGTIVVSYTAPERGVIVSATPSEFKSVGLNQFNKATSVLDNTGITSGAIASKSGKKLAYCLCVGGLTNGYVVYDSNGTVSDVGFCATKPEVGTKVTVPSGTVVGATSSTITPTTDGYIVVETTNPDRLCIHPKWSGQFDTTYEDYTESVIVIPTEDISSTALPTATYGMPSVEDTYDEIDVAKQLYYKRVERIVYSAENLDNIIALGVAYDYDDNFIYYVRPDVVTYHLNTSLIGMYDVNDYGTEQFTDTLVPLGTDIIYGQNLRDKLRIDVLTISPQELTEDQKAQVQKNLGMGSAIFTIPASLWVYDSENITYPYSATISTNKFTDDSIQEWFLISTTNPMEGLNVQDSINDRIITSAVFTSTSVVFYATDLPTTTVKIAVK